MNRRDSRSDSGYSRRGFRRRKACRFCQNPDIKIDYKDAKALKPFISEKGRIIPRRITGNCARHQRELALAIKRARVLAILPFTALTV